MRQFDADFDLGQNADEADPRELWEMNAVRDFTVAAGDLLRTGYTETDLARLIEESLPLAEEIDENAPVKVAPF